VLESPEKGDDAPELLVRVRDTERGHSRQLDTVLRDPEELTIAPFRCFLGEIRRLRIHALAECAAFDAGRAVTHRAHRAVFLETVPHHSGIQRRR
jgi:hypothetical protein